MRHVQADDFGELLFLQQRLQQTPFAAAQIQNARRTAGFSAASTEPSRCSLSDIGFSPVAADVRRL